MLRVIEVDQRGCVCIIDASFALFEAAIWLSAIVDRCSTCCVAFPSWIYFFSIKFFFFLFIILEIYYKLS